MCKSTLGTVAENEELLQHGEGINNLLNIPFTKTEMGSKENQNVITRKYPVTHYLSSTTKYGRMGNCHKAGKKQSLFECAGKEKTENKMKQDQ